MLLVLLVILVLVWILLSYGIHSIREQKRNQRSNLEGE
uniref:Uncharacterized protein n=1 Tax=Megaselia scalaris TaxID=36166 RepID=T1GZA8_MEGSC